MRAFNKNPNYLSVTPDITWDDSFIPPELYDDIKTKLTNLEDAKEIQKKEEEEGPLASEEKAKATQIDEGKAKETAAQDEENPDNTENPKKKRTRENSESNLFGDIEDGGTSAHEATEEPPAKRVKLKNSIDDVGNTVTILPPPCRRCNMLGMECISIGCNPACNSCLKARLPCSLSKAPPKPNVIPNTTGDEEKTNVKTNDKGKAKETAEDKEMLDDTENLPKTRSHREIHYAGSKSIPELDDRSSTEDEDVDQLDSTTTTTTIDTFIPNDPKVRLCWGNSSFLYSGKFDTRGPVRSLRKGPQGMCS
jgi:hypothetical protein